MGHEHKHPDDFQIEVLGNIPTVKKFPLDLDIFSLLILI